MKNLDFDRSQLGKLCWAGTYNVRDEIILEICDSIGESNPIHVNKIAAQKHNLTGLLAPPGFCALLVRNLVRPDIRLEYGNSSFLANEAIEEVHPICSGDIITIYTKLKNVYAKTGRSGTMVFVVWETIFINQDGYQVACIEESYVMKE